jgi:hypothetical protein
VVTLGILSAVGLLQSTESSLTSSSIVNVAATAQQWIVASLNTTPQNYSTLTVTWPLLDDYTSYILQWSTDADFSGASSATVTGSSKQVTGLKESTNYYFRIQAVGAPTQGWSTPQVIKTPGAPSILTAADIVAFDPAGALWNYGVAGTAPVRKSIDSTPVSRPDSFFVTDWNGDGIQDLVLKNTNDQLELRKGLPEGGFTSSIIGQWGWNDYDITVGKWKKTDTLPSIIAIQRSTGDLYLYENPDGGAHGARIKFDSGWTGLLINLVDYDMDGNMDVIDRYPNGHLWLYRTNGAGSFIAEARSDINFGWEVMDSIRMSYGAEGPGTRGFVARNGSTGDLFYYAIGKSTIMAPRKFNTGFGPYVIAGN